MGQMPSNAKEAIAQTYWINDTIDGERMQSDATQVCNNAD